MEPRDWTQYWSGRWDEGRIGFHEGAANRWLAEHIGVLGYGVGRRVLVPLCGKSVDLAFLAAHGFDVVGVEVALSAAEAFYAEAGLTPARADEGGFVRLSSSSIEIVVGDFFAVTPAIVGLFDVFYDRAAIVALPPEMRARYATTLRSLMKPDARGLLVTFEHDAKGHEPPFSVREEEIAERFADYERITLGSVDTLGDRSALRDRGATFALDRAYAMRAP